MKWIFRLIGLVILVVVLLVVGVLMLPGARLAKLASDQLSTQLGRDVAIEGDVSLAFWPTLSVSTGPIRVANRAGFSDTPLFAADAAQLGLDAAKLMSGQVQIKQLIAERPRILLQQKADGSANWEFAPASSGDVGAQSSSGSGGGSGASDGGSDGLPPITIDRLRITDASFRFESEGAAPVALDALDIDLAWPDMAGPADIKLGLSPAGQPVAVTATIASPLNLMAGGAHPVSGTVSTNGGQASFNGRASLTPEVAGSFSADLSSTSAFLASLGLGAVDLPKGAGQSIKASGEVTFTADQRVSLRGLQASLDHHTLSGDADVTLSGPRPKVNAKLAAGPLVLGQESTGKLASSGGGSGSSGGGSASGGSTQSSGWSKAPIDASGLSTVDAEVLITTPSIKVGDLSFGQSRFLLTIDRARAVFGIRELAAYDGALNGEFVMNNRSGLSVGGKLKALGINLGNLLDDAQVTDRIEGAADAEMSFLGSGQNMDAIMRSLSGKGAVKMGSGVITGIDLDQLFRAGGSGGGTTVFDTAGATFTIDGGVLRNKDLLLTIPDGEARGDGKVNLGAQTINYTITPKSLKARGGKGLAIPVTIKGPWSGPKIDADLAAALELSLQEEKKALEEKARKEVSERLSKELDVEVKEDDTVEDVLRRKVDDEIKKGLQNLLGGN